MTAYNRTGPQVYYIKEHSLCDVAGTQVAWLRSLFCRSDSRAVARTFLRCITKLTRFSLTSCTWRAGYNNENTYGVDGAGFGQAPSLLKANGAGSMTPKRSRQQVVTTSGLGEVYLE